MRRPVHGGNLGWAAAIAGCSPDLILDFSASINPLGPPESAIAAIHASLNQICAYPDPGYWQLRVALGQFHNVEPTWVLPGNGSAELLTWACRELAQLDATVLMTPAFGDYPRSLQAYDARLIKTSLLGSSFGRDTHQFGLSTDIKQGPEIESGEKSDSQPQAMGFPQWLQMVELALQEQGLAARNCGLLLNNPHNPTGTLFRRQDLLSALDRFGLVVMDEAFMDFLPPDTQLEAEHSLVTDLQNLPNIVILRSLTKFYSLPGLRLGYALAHPDRLQRWQRWRDPWPVNALAAAAAIAVLKDQPFRQQTWSWFVNAKTQLEQGLSQLPKFQVLPSAANFLLVRSNVPVPPLQAALLQQHRILIRDCLSFPELGDRYFRVAVRSPEENQRLLEGLAAVLAADKTTD